MMGYLRDASGGFGVGLMVLGAVTLAGGFVAVTLHVAAKPRAQKLQGLSAE